MAKKYGDAVVFVQKQRDGSVRRVNAIVLGSSQHVPLTTDRKAANDTPVQEHLDLAFPVLSLAPEGQALKTRNMEEIFRPAYAAAPWVEDAWIGWEEPAAPVDPALTTGQLVPLTQLVDLATQVSAFDPSLEVCPDAVVPSATTALAVAIAMIAADYPAQLLSEQPAPVFETKTYSDGSTATGVAPLPDQSPEQQEAAAGAGLPSAAGLDAVAAEQQTAQDTAAA